MVQITEPAFQNLFILEQFNIIVWGGGGGGGRASWEESHIDSKVCNNKIVC